MRIAIDVSPLTSGNFLQHRVRGTGSYLNNLKKNLLKYHDDNEYEFFNIEKMFENNPDVIHYPYFEPYFLTLPSNIGENSIVTVHDFTPLVFKQHFPPGIRGKIKWEIQKRRLRRAGAIITDSNSSKADINKYTGIDISKINVVYLAADSQFRQVSNEKKRGVMKKFDLPNSFVLYVGDVTWNKNLPGLIRAIEKTDFHLAIVGAAFVSNSYDKNNPWNKNLAKSQKLASQNNKIIPLGFVNSSDLVSLYNAATLFVMPSFYEGFGLPILEAMSCGTPVVTSPKGSIPEVAGEAAYFVNPNDIDSIATGISKVIGNADLKEKLIRSGLSQAKKFSWKKTADQTFNVYKKLFKPRE